MRHLPYLGLVLGLLVASACDAAAPSRPELEGRDDITEVSTEDLTMNAAIEEAKRTLPEFLALLGKRTGKISEIGFKYPLGGWEHIWVENVAVDGDYLTGKLANVPAQSEFKMGDKVRVAKTEVSDWAYRDETGVMQGHYTTRILLDQLDPNEAKGIRAYFKW